MARKKLLVEKRNILNDIISREFTLQELRLFSIYLGKINARQQSTRVVRLPLKEFFKIMDLQAIRVEYLKGVTHNLLTKVICLPTATGGYNQFQLFKRCRVEKDAYGKWYFEIDAHDDALPLLFDYQRDYFTYELWNVLNLESVNQFRMYEVLKQYEKRGERTLSVSELKTLLGIEEKEYPRWNNFRMRVLDACQQALQEKTDICFTYEPCARSGRGGKIQALRFTITKNTSHVDKLHLEKFVDSEVLAIAKQTDSAPEAACLDFITELLPIADRLSILRAANGNAALVESFYDIAKQQENIENLAGWLIAMLKKSFDGAVSPKIEVKSQKKNRFNNFAGRGYDFDELERLELELLKEKLKDKTD
jgi:plasmid replication initiation protein